MKRFWKNQKGVTMMEVLVTVALLAIVVVPCLSSFVMAQRGNAKAAQVYYEYTEAQNLMETLKGIQVPEGENGLVAWNDEIDRIIDASQSENITIDKHKALDGDGNFLNYYIIEIKNCRDGELILEGVISP